MSGSDPLKQGHRSNLEETGAFVHGRLQRLLTQLDSPATAATLAHLRAARGRQPGSVPTIWDLTMDGAPGAPRGDEPTAQERAIHVALTTFAAHQQSRQDRMHQAGVSLGTAVGALERRRPHSQDSLSPVRRRFNALVTATSFEEVTHHVGGIVALLRAESIPLDYARFADDLVRLQHPARADFVLRGWARDLYRLDKTLDLEPAKYQEEP